MGYIGTLQKSWFWWVKVGIQSALVLSTELFAGVWRLGLAIPKDKHPTRVHKVQKVYTFGFIVGKIIPKKCKAYPLSY